MKPFAVLILFAISVSAAWAKGGQPLTGKEIETLFSGTAMRGDFVADGSAWAERTTKSGRVLDLLQGGKHVGAWFVAGDRLCYVYFGKPPSQPCYIIERANGLVLFADSKSGRPVARAMIVESSRL